MYLYISHLVVHMKVSIHHCPNVTAERWRQNRLSGWMWQRRRWAPGRSALSLLSGGQQVSVLRVMAYRLLLNVLGDVNCQGAAVREEGG